MTPHQTTMKPLFVFIMLMSQILFSFGQKANELDWDGFSQTIDVSAWQGGQFRFTGFVRAENTSTLTNARLWARVDSKKSVTFLENMHKTPILSNEWKAYTIEGPIDQGSTKLRIGGLYFGNGKYYFDNFSLELKPRDGTWEKASLTNDGFESEFSVADWKIINGIKGFDVKLTTDNAYAGKNALSIDASIRTGRGKFVTANGIQIYYEEFGKGDTVLLLHGNSQSTKAFEKQIPELSKYFHVIAMDSRGQGHSSEDGKPMSYELMAEDVHSLLDQLKLAKIHVLGWSDGGITGLILAMKHPDRVKKLAVMGANLFNDTTSIVVEFNDMIRKEKARLVALNQPENQFEIRMIDLMLNEPNIKPDALKAIQCPTLVMAGSKDIIKEEHTRLIACKIDKAQLVIFRNGTHFEPTEHPKRFNRTVVEFLGR